MQFIFRLLPTTICCLLVTVNSWSQVSITSTTTTYTQNFNTLRSTSGTSTALPTGWRLLETGTNANTRYTTDAGTNTTGDTYSYGTGTSTERALGVLRSGSLIASLGFQVRNSTGQTITSLTISYTGEQWRCGTAGRTDQLDFQYSLNASSLSNGTWIDANGLDFVSPFTTSTGARDGNTTANRTTRTATITGISIPNNAVFWLRWTDFDASGSDDGLAVDDFTLRLNAGDVTPPTATAFNPANGATGIARSGNLVLSFSEPIVKGNAGSIAIRRSSDNTIIQSTLVTATSVTVNSNTATIPFSTLATSTGYYVTVDAGAFRDAAGNAFAGISNTTGWTFTTEAAPVPAITVSPSSLSFGFIPAGSVSAAQSVTFSTSNFSSGVTVTAPASFEVSKDGIVFSTSIVYTLAEVQTVQTLLVRFAPAVVNTTYSGSINFNTTGLNSNPVSVSGNSIAPVLTQDTLKVVSWNIEWFGGSLGPADDNLQEQHVRTVLQNINADVYGLQEIVSIPRLQNIVNQMPGFSMVVADFCSNGTVASSCGGAQKLAYIFRTSKVKLLRTYAMLRNGSANASYNWSSGRLPYQLEADVTLNGSTRRMQFFNIHGKANTSDFIESYNRRRNGAREMHDSLVVQYAGGNWMVLGDYNDDLDRTITTQIAPDTTTSFIAFKTNPNFFSVTLPLSLARQKSTVSFNDVIDHFTIGSQLNQFYIPNSARILRTEVESWIPNYGSTASDHYPVVTSYVWTAASNPLMGNRKVTTAAAESKCSIRAVAHTTGVDVYINDVIAQTTTVQLMNLNGNILAQSNAQTVGGITKVGLVVGKLPKGLYIVRVQNATGTYTQKVLIGL